MKSVAKKDHSITGYALGRVCFERAISDIIESFGWALLRPPFCVFMDTSAVEKVALKPISLGQVLKRGFSDAWDRLGLVVASSLVWSLSVIVPISIFSLARNIYMFVAGLVVAWIISTPILIGIFRMAQKVVYRDDPSFGDVMGGFRVLRWSAYAMSAINIGTIAILSMDAVYFLGVTGQTKLPKLLTLGIGVLSVYVLVGWMLAMLYQSPALVAQKPFGQRPGAIQAIKKSWLLAIGNPVFTIGLFVVILGFSVLSALSVIGMLILYAGVVSIILTRALRELFVRYGVVEESSEENVDSGWHIK